MAKKNRLTGAMLGVSFDVVASEISEDEINISGEAWGMPVDVTFKKTGDFIAATGRLLGNEFTITRREAD